MAGRGKTMAAYLILNFGILTLLSVAAWRSGYRYASNPIYFAAGVLLLLTLVFDNAIIAAGIVEYTTTRISGIYIFKAPIEDFAYCIGAVLLVPVLWKITGKK